MSRRMLAIAGAGFTALLIGVVVLVVVVVVVADGEDEPAGTPTPATLGGPTMAAPPEELQDCLEEQGVEPPEAPVGSGQGPDPDQVEALEACAEFMPDPQGGPPGLPAPAG